MDCFVATAAAAPVVVAEVNNKEVDIQMQSHLNIQANDRDRCSTTGTNQLASQCQ
jgi:hypothetical protein